MLSKWMEPFLNVAHVMRHMAQPFHVNACMFMSRSFLVGIQELVAAEYGAFSCCLRAQLCKPQHKHGRK